MSRWRRAWSSFSAVALGLALIAVASLVLLASDLGHRRPPAHAVPRVALFQFASRPILDEGVQGIVDALAARGFTDGSTVQLRRYNAENDMATAAAIARSIIDERFDLVVTASTPCFQAMAAANRRGAVKHVFGIVTDPFGAGVPIDRQDTSRRPPGLAGVGTFQPVKEAFRLAKRMYPGLRTVGEVWSPAEACSEACTRLAREVSAELGITLVEAPVDSSAGVLEAARSLVARGVEALWIGGDNTVEMAASSVVKAAREGRIPVFANAPNHAGAGALFGLGADYYEVGRVTGNVAADVLGGRDPRSIPIENVVPQHLAIDEAVVADLRDPWSVPDDVRRQAQGAAAAAPVAPPGARFTVGLAYFAPDPTLDQALEGFFAGLAELGFVEGANLTIRRTHAQGEIVQIPSMLQALEATGVDAVVTFSTPVLAGALAAVKRAPIVFTYVTDPLAAGAGRSLADHLPSVTGTGCFPPLEETLELIGELAPAFGRLGVVYNSGEANSTKVVTVLRELAGARGVRVVEGTAASSADVGPAVQGVLARGVDAFYLPGDNTAYLAFDVIAQETAKARVPLIVDNDVFVSRGAIAGVGVRYDTCARAAAPMLARVLRGESPAGIPMENVSRQTVVLNPEVAAHLGIALTPALLARANPTGAAQAPKPPARPGRPWRLHFLSYTETSFVEESLAGVRAQLAARGLEEGRDVILKVASAQGDMATLTTLLDLASGDRADCILLNSTVALQAAVRRVTALPVVFGNVANPVLAGAGASFTEHAANITGIATLSDYAGMTSLLKEILPHARRVGTLVVPGEVNSVYNRDTLRQAMQEAGIELVSVPVATAADVPDAALALCSGKLDAVCQVTANVVDNAFAGLAQAAAASRTPLFAFSSSLAGQGAAVVLSRDYEQVGRDMVDLALRVLAGERPGDIPFTLPSRTVLVVSPANAAASGLELPAALVARADRVVHR